VSALLELRSISHSFRGLQVLRNVSLRVEQGAICGLIGPNGAGKSTLFNIASGFLPADACQVGYACADVTRHSVERRSYAGLVRTFQTPQVFAHLTVWENLMAGCYKLTSSGLLGNLVGTPGSRRELAAMRTTAERLCREFKLDAVRDVLAGKLPGGMQRLLELARACVGAPRLLCLDEPSAGLNSQEVAQLVQALQRLQQNGMTILLVSHDMDLVTVASVIHVLCFGEIIAAGSFAEVRADARVREAYLGV